MMEMTLTRPTLVLCLLVLCLFRNTWGRETSSNNVARLPSPYRDDNRLVPGAGLGLGGQGGLVGGGGMTAGGPGAGLSPAATCRALPVQLSQAQANLCKRYPDVTLAALHGQLMAVGECQYQLRGNRWNCSGLAARTRNPRSHPIFSRGYRETAFAQAILSAGMATEVSRACSMGKLETCGCRQFFQESMNTWSWQGCERNVDFADWFTKNFHRQTDGNGVKGQPAKAKDVLFKVHQHNNRVGRLAAKQQVEQTCKCHGMSGSCVMKTCWKTASPLRNVGASLKVKYGRATKVKVENSNSARLKLLPAKSEEPIGKLDLVYVDASPNYCDGHPDMALAGTTGRVCNASASRSAADGCETLCCGRGYNTLRQSGTQKCNCSFQWCCHVVCQNCTRNELITVCK